MSPLDESIRACVREEIQRIIPQLISQPAPVEEFIDTSRAAELTGLCRQFFECGRSNKNPNQPPHYKIGRRVLYRRSELVAWMRHRAEA